MRNIAIGSLVISAWAAAGSANAETRNYEVSSFNAIKISSGVAMEVAIGGEQSVRVESDKGDFEDLVIRVEDGELHVKRDWKDNWGWGRKKPRYKVFATVVELNDIDASSGSSVKASGVSEDDFFIDVSSGASVSVKGACDALDADASSGASVHADDLICKKVSAEASSGASVSVHASEEIDAQASSGASVTVSGGPEKTRTKKSSGGSVRLRE